ncbi:transposase [Geomonas sp. Red69]|uniref:transposase n=1 Tax=Geomonas diazotrophica TaxID=2843197 RepID=UPI001C1145E8|nr:transposase [Geomonas diazotrophica]MBU5639094.1 transposase [Geomonas diazotrophica]
MRSNRKYDSEFKQEAIKLVVDEGRTIREVESSLGITHGVLKGWVQKHRDQQDPVKVHHASVEAELKHLRKENERLLREREILKKAVAIFSTDPNRYSGS